MEVNNPYANKARSLTKTQFDRAIRQQEQSPTTARPLQAPLDDQTGGRSVWQSAKANAGQNMENVGGKEAFASQATEDVVGAASEAATAGKAAADAALSSQGTAEERFATQAHLADLFQIQGV